MVVRLAHTFVKLDDSGDPAEIADMGWHLAASQA